MKTKPSIYKVLAFVILGPGSIGMIIPLIIAAIDPGSYGIAFFTYLGIPFLIIGPTILGYCVYLFWKIGFGTLAPWDPPKEIVKNSLYRYCRNPMYVGVWLTIFGWSLALNSPLNLLWLILVILIITAFVIFYEEPALEQQYGETWQEYKKQVPRRFVF